MKTFPLSILTPERAFYQGEASSITVESIGGRLTVLADHIPMVTALGVGAMLIRDEKGEARTAFHSEGFMEVAREGVSVLCQACEWPEEIDEARAEQALARARQRLEEKQEKHESHRIAQNKLAIMRAMTRIKVRKHIGS